MNKISTYAISFLAALSLCFASVKSQAGETAPTHMTALEHRALRSPILERVNNIRHRKFRRARHFQHNVWWFLPARRQPNVDYWRSVLGRSWSLTPHPLYIRATHWFRTSGAECVKSREGSWTDPNAPYWGGMQADLSFQKTYGPEFYRRWGTADHWPPWAQMVMAYRGWLARGWYPWPNTARACGLL